MLFLRRIVVILSCLLKWNRSICSSLKTSPFFIRKIHVVTNQIILYFKFGWRWNRKLIVKNSLKNFLRWFIGRINWRWICCWKSARILLNIISFTRSYIKWWILWRLLLIWLIARRAYIISRIILKLTLILSGISYSTTICIILWITFHIGIY